MKERKKEDTRTFQKSNERKKIILFCCYDPKMSTERERRKKERERDRYRKIKRYREGG